MSKYSKGDKMYSKEVMERFKHPKHVGDIKDANAIGRIGNPQCGDVMELFVKIEKNKEGEEYIKDIKVKTYGCVAAISSSDVLCDLAIGKTLEEADKITKDDVLNKLGFLPPIKQHCSVLAQDALRKALENYRKKSKV